MTLPEFARIVAGVEPRLRRHIITGLRSAALRLQGMVIESIQHALPRSAVDTGGLIASVHTRSVHDGAITDVSAPHAGAIEHGTRPFWPPQAPLAAWALRKGLAQNEREAATIAFLVARSISRRGIAPRHFFATAWAAFPPVLVAEINAELEQAARDA